MPQENIENTDNQNIAIKQLRERISDIIADNPQFDEGFYLYFWLQAGKFDVEKTEGLVRETVKWRKEKDTASAAKLDYHPGIQKCFPIEMDGKTKNGFAVWTGAAGSFRFGETIKTFGREAVEYYWLQLLCKAEKQLIERNREVLKQNGDCVHAWPAVQKSWLILNTEHLLLADLMNREAVSVVLVLIKMALAHFPILQGTLVFINAWKLLEIFFKVIRPMFNGTKIGMHVFGTNENKWKSFVQEYVDPRDIGSKYGGNLDKQT